MSDKKDIKKSIIGDPDLIPEKTKKKLKKLAERTDAYAEKMASTLKGTPAMEDVEIPDSLHRWPAKDDIDEILVELYNQKPFSHGDLLAFDVCADVKDFSSFIVKAEYIQAFFLREAFERIESLETTNKKLNEQLKKFLEAADKENPDAQNASEQSSRKSLEDRVARLEARLEILERNLGASATVDGEDEDILNLLDLDDTGDLIESPTPNKIVFNNCHFGTAIIGSETGAGDTYNTNSENAACCSCEDDDEGEGDPT